MYIYFYFQKLSGRATAESRNHACTGAVAEWATCSNQTPVKQVYQKEFQA